MLTSVILLVKLWYCLVCEESWVQQLRAWCRLCFRVFQQRGLKRVLIHS